MMKKILIGLCAALLLLAGLIYQALSQHVDECCETHGEMMSLFITDCGRSPADGRDYEIWRGLFYALKGCDYNAERFEKHVRACESKFSFSPHSLEDVTNSVCQVVRVRNIPATVFFEATRKLNDVIHRQSLQWAKEGYGDDLVQFSGEHKVKQAVPYLEMMLTHPKIEESVKAKVRTALEQIAR